MMESSRGSRGLLPQQISSSTMPKLYTSDAVLALPVAAYSGSMYPMFPARNAVSRLLAAAVIEELRQPEIAALGAHGH